MNILKHPLFIGAALLTTANELIERMGYNIPYLNSYLDDLSCFPVVLTLGLAFLRMMTGSQDHVLSRIQIIMAVIYFSVMFEGILPAFSDKYTRDLFDIIAYSTGAFLFARYINRKPGTRMEAQPA